MLDTIKFVIPVDNNQYKEIKKMSIEHVKFDHKNKEMLVRYWKAEQQLGSHNRNFNIFLSSEDEINIEFSIPKYYYGHNIYMVYKSQLFDIINDLYSDLLTLYPSFPDPELWRIQRLDLCYNWRYATETQCKSVLDILQSYPFPRKKAYFRPGTVMYIGSTYTVKFYSKNQEFFKHDFREIQKTGNHEMAHELLERSKGVLRYEVTMRRTSFPTYFLKKDVYLQDIYNSNLTKMLQSFLNKSLQFQNNGFMNKTEIYNKLLRKYPSAKATKLFTYYLATKDENNVVSRRILNTLTRFTIHRYKTDLIAAGVGMLHDDDNISFKLGIPSDYATNSDPAELAARQVGD